MSAKYHIIRVDLDEKIVMALRVFAVNKVGFSVVRVTNIRDISLYENKLFLELKLKKIRSTILKGVQEQSWD